MYRHEQVSTTDLPIKLIVHTEDLENQNVLRHWHQALELDYIIQGNAEFVVSGRQFSVSSGDIMIINSNEIHSVRPVRIMDHNLSLTFLIPYEFMHQEWGKINNYWFNISKNFSQVEVLKQRLFNYYQHTQLKSNDKKFLLKSDIYLILYSLFHDFLEDETKLPGLLTVPTLHKLANVIDFISQHSSERLSLLLIAQEVHWSEGYLSRTFKQQMGKGVMEYVNLVRLKNAFEMLTNTDKDIEAISDLTGFPNVKSFRKIFNEIYQTTPGQYRLGLKRS